MTSFAYLFISERWFYVNACHLTTLTAKMRNYLTSVFKLLNCIQKIGCRKKPISFGFLLLVMTFFVCYFWLTKNNGVSILCDEIWNWSINIHTFFSISIFDNLPCSKKMYLFGVFSSDGTFLLGFDLTNANSNIIVSNNHVWNLQVNLINVIHVKIGDQSKPSSIYEMTLTNQNEESLFISGYEVFMQFMSIHSHSCQYEIS